MKAGRKKNERGIKYNRRGKQGRNYGRERAIEGQGGKCQAYITECMKNGETTIGVAPPRTDGVQQHPTV